MALAVLYREEPKEYDFGPGHSFRGDRYEVFPQFLKDERCCRYQITIEEGDLIPPRFTQDPSFDARKEIVKEIKRNLKAYWNCLS